MNFETLGIVMNHASLEMKRQAAKRTLAGSDWAEGLRPNWWAELARTRISQEQLGDKTPHNAAEVLLCDEGAKAVMAVSINLYYYWFIIHTWAGRAAIDETEAERTVSIGNAIIGMRSAARDPSLYATGRFLRGDITPPLICEFTDAGLILWDRAKRDWALNPLFFTPEEIVQEAARRRPWIDAATVQREFSVELTD